MMKRSSGADSECGRDSKKAKEMTVDRSLLDEKEGSAIAGNYQVRDDDSDDEDDKYLILRWKILNDKIVPTPEMMMKLEERKIKEQTRKVNLIQSSPSIEEIHDNISRLPEVPPQHRDDEEDDISWKELKERFNRLKNSQLAREARTAKITIHINCNPDCCFLSGCYEYLRGGNITNS